LSSFDLSTSFRCDFPDFLQHGAVAAFPEVMTGKASHADSYKETL
jgi:hypothetical protein